jgi:SAM-dependent methyltransferase
MHKLATSSLESTATRENVLTDTLSHEDPHSNRAIVAGWFLQGTGLEIGALHQPLAVHPGIEVKYVDRMSVDDLRRQYGELNGLPLVSPHIIDDGETLSQVGPASQDFVIASHFLEHCQDPVGTLRHFVRVLRPGGVVFLVIPDKLFTFDKDRPSTTLDHLIRDHEEGPAWSRRAHYLEWAEKVDRALPGEAALERARFLMEINYSIHFHVWTKGEALQMLLAANEKYELGFHLLCFVDNGDEGIYVLEKARPGSSGAMPRSMSLRDKDVPIDEPQGKIAELRAELEKWQRLAREATAINEAITSSIGWQLLGRYREIRARLLPDGSRRQRLYLKVIQGLRKRFQSRG